MVNFILFCVPGEKREGSRRLSKAGCSGKKGEGKGNLHILFIHTSISFQKKKKAEVKFQVLRAQTVDQTLDVHTTTSMRIIDGVV